MQNNKEMYNSKQSTVLTACIMMSVFVTVISNIFATRSVQIGPMQQTAAVLMFPVCYVLHDIIGEFFKVWKIALLTLVTYVIQTCIYLLASVASSMPTVPGNEYLAECFSTVMGFTPVVVLASFCAYAAGSTLNAAVLRSLPKKVFSFRKRAWLSTVVGEIADTWVFLAVLGLSIEWKNVLMVAGLKICMETVLLPFTGIVVKKIENLNPEVSYYG